ncbi:MAG: hypothetical protein KGL68_13500 [Burkholderiales bacterium]|nr:hypothetical protein [Burkholderiales bacterium]
MMRHPFPRFLKPALLGAIAVLGSCTTVTRPPEPAPPQPAAPAPAAPPAPARATLQPSQATTPRAYRIDAAHHIYDLNADRIWKGRLPPLLYAVGVLQVDVDGRGNVRGMHWMRAPKQAPEVIAEIERTVRAASPFPAPARMGKVVYTDVWLWDKSGRFQLDTLTEGQAGNDYEPR